MKTLYESILDMDEKNSDIAALRYQVETTTGWTLSSDGKYILSGSPHFPAEINTTFGNNSSWFVNLVNCAKKYNLKIQPIGELIIPAHSLYLLEGLDIEYICELKVYVNNPADVNLTKIKSPILRTTFVEERNSFCEIKSIVLQKTPMITADVELYADDSDMENIKDMNCINLIVNDARGIFTRVSSTLGLQRLQQLVDNNPDVYDFFIKVVDKNKKKYYQVKLKGKKVDGLMGKSENTLVSKEVLEDFYKKNGDFKQWYEKHK